MSDEKNASENQDEAKGGSKMKLMIVVGGMMVLEAAGVFLFATIAAKEPAGIQAGEQGLQVDESEETREVQIVNGRFQNHTSGRVWRWEIELWLKVKNKNAEAAEAILERRQAELTQEVGRIVSRAQHAHLKEPDHQTISRLLREAMEPFFTPPTADEPIFEDVLLPKCSGNPSDF